MDVSRLKPSPAMVVAILALVFAATGVTWAATSLPRDSVGSAQVRDNSVRSGDIRDRNVRAADLGTNSVSGAKIATNAVDASEITTGGVGSSEIADESILGDDVNESTLGRVPDAARLGGIGAADYLTNRTIVPIHESIPFGERRTIVKNGPVSLVAECHENIAGAQDELRLTAATTAAGAFMQGDTPHGGPGVSDSHLDPGTPSTNRVMGGVITFGGNPDAPAADDDIDTGFVAGPNGEYIGIDETTMYGLHIGSSDCLIAGSAVVLR